MSMLRDYLRLNSSFLLTATLVCVSVLYVVFCQPQIIDGDYWWYLASGKIIVAEGIPGVNSFSYTHGNYPWEFTQWLFALLLFGIETTFGELGVEILFICALCATFLLTLDTIRLKSGRIAFGLVMPVMFWAVWASSIRFIIRPHLATLFLLALMLNLLERRPRHLNLVFFLVAVVWSNLHAGYFFGLMVCGACTLGAYFEKDTKKLKDSSKTLLWFFLGTLLNVHFLYPYYYIVSNLWVTQLAPVSEMANIGSLNSFPFWGMSIFLFATISLQYKGRDYRSLLLLLSFFPLSLFAVRIIPKMILLALPGACAAFQSSVITSKRFFWLIVLALWGVTGVAFIALDNYAPVAGWGVSNGAFPSDAADFITANSLKGNMYNGFDEGGYLTNRFYPDRQVFIDGRIQAYPPGFFEEYYQANGSQRWQSLMDKYDVSFALIRRQIVGGRETFNRGAFLEALDWPLIYLDGKYLVYAQRRRGNDQVIAKQQHHLVSWGASVDDLKKMARGNPVQMRRELERIPIETLQLQSDVLRFADAAFFSGANELCERILQYGRNVFKNSSDIVIKLAVLHASRGQFERALSELQPLIDGNDNLQVQSYAKNMRNRIRAMQR